MKFGAKLGRLTEQRGGPTAVANALGVGPSVLNNYFRRGSIPRADIALKLARVLAVNLEWLIDDDQPWEAKDTPPSPSAIPTAALTTELANRYLALADRLADHLDRAEQTDWVRVANAFAELPADAPPPAEFAKEIELFNAILRDRFGLLAYDVVRNPVSFASPTDRRVRDASALRGEALMERLGNMWSKVKGLSAVHAAQNVRGAVAGQWPKSQVELAKRHLKDAMRELRPRDPRRNSRAAIKKAKR